jgi:hypothetical protein
MTQGLRVAIRSPEPRQASTLNREPVIVNVDGAVAHVRLNRPDKLNVLDLDMLFRGVGGRRPATHIHAQIADRATGSPTC